MPRDLSFSWLQERRDLGFFDVLHIHSIELATQQVIDDVIGRCLAAGKGVVATIHDIHPMFDTDQERYRDSLRRLAAHGIRLVTLTDGAARALGEITGTRPVVLPHGHVLDPADPRFGTCAGSGGPGTRYAMYGGFRPNRAMYPVVANLTFGAAQPEDSLCILTRALSPLELRSCDDAVSVIAAATARPDRITLQLRPFPADDEIVSLLQAADVLVMPYLWGTHSGQLELAFDLGIIPVITDTGFFREQWQRYQHIVPEPVWLNWATGSPYSHGSRLLDALYQSQRRSLRWKRKHLDQFRDLRRAEHSESMSAYYALYTQGQASSIA